MRRCLETAKHSWPEEYCCEKKISFTFFTRPLLPVALVALVALVGLVAPMTLMAVVDTMQWPW